jgi:hypothetical protein
MPLHLSRYNQGREPVEVILVGRIVDSDNQLKAARRILIAGLRQRS